MSGERPTYMSQAAYARRRGVSPMAVSLAIKSRRLVESVVVVEGSPKIGDPDLADREWAQNTETSHAPSASELDAAGRQAKYWDALAREAKFREQIGELVPAADLKRAVDDAFAGVRAALLAVPSRARQALPHLTVSDVGTLDKLVREALEHLALKAGPGALRAD